MKKRQPFSPHFVVLNVRTYQILITLLGLVFGAFTLQAQDYETTGNSSDWDDPAAWNCIGSPGKCNSNPFPDNEIRNTTVTINHSITYTDNSPIKLLNNGELIIGNNASLTISSNLNIDDDGVLTVTNGQIHIGPSVLNNEGVINLTNALLTKNGNIVNDGDINLNNACIHVLSGNFNNDEEVNGTGGVKVLSGNINNDEDWSPNVIYYFSGNSSGLPGSPSTEEEVDAFCECLVINCDIIPGYPENSKYNGIIGSALFSLANNFDPAQGFNDLIYQIRDNNGVFEVLIEIVMFENNYNAVVAYLGTFGISTNDFISDVYDPADDERVITLFFPISGLLDLDTRDDIVRQVFEVSPPIPNTGLIDSQGDVAQNSFIARLGWNLSGAGIKIGVISDSFDRNLGVIAGTSPDVQTDINNGDLPGGANAVNVLQDYPYGPATDEGRAMLQIIHDVAPDAELFFHTGSVSEGNMAAGIADLVAAGCDVIVDDLTYMRAPYYTDGLVAQAVEDATAAGVVYFSSAGNFGIRSFEGTFSPFAGNSIRHDFGGTDLQQLTLDVGQYIIGLQWNDPWSSLGSATGATKDIDIYLANDDGSVLYGFNRDNLGNDPVELIPFTVLNPTTTNIVIENLTGGAVDFKYVVFRAGDDGEFDAVPALDKSTVVGHANAQNCISVGAVRYDNTPQYGGVFTAQTSSSRGGTLTDGQVREQPLVMSPTGVDTSVELGAPNFEGPPFNNFPPNPYPNFFGTSAAAPHAAGIAALVLEAKQTFGVDPTNVDPNFSIRNLMINNATDMGAPGYDVNNGYGFVLADDVIGSFSNPSPNLIQFNLANLDPTQEPGDVEFVVIIEGEYFTEESVVIFRDEELETTFIDENTLEATIPEFIGNPPIYVFTPPNSLTNGSDGGDSNVLTFDDPVILDVEVKADDVTRRYGEANPATLTFTTDVDDTGNPLSQEELDLLTPSVTLSTAADASSVVGIYAIDVAFTNIDVGLLELYNFIAEPGALVVDPMPVTIQPSVIAPIVYGDPLPEITFDYTFGEPGGTPATVDTNVADLFASNHANILSIANGGFGIVDPGDLTNILSIVNDEPFLNLLSLVNVNIYASESTLDQAGTAQQNLLSLVNGTGDEKVVFIGADLFDPDNIDNGDLSEITNLLSLVNILSIANGTSIVNGFSIANGVSLTNILSIANGVPIANLVSLVNGAMSLVNGTPITNSVTVQAVYDALANSYSIVNTSDIPADPTTADPILVIPINVYTGCNVGMQYVIPGGIIDENFEVYYQPREFEILPADLIVTTQDASTTYGSDLPEFTAVIDGIVPKDTEADVFPDGLDFSVPCTECGVADSPHIISASSSNTSANYNVTYNNTGLLTVNKFDLTVTVDDATIAYGDTGPFAFTVTSDPAVLPYGELLDDVLGPLSFTPDDGCTSDTVITVSPEVQPDNYAVTYVDGALTIDNADLTIEVLPAFIAEGDPLPNFDTQVSGLVCNDPEPVITNFIILDQNGSPVSGTPDAGEYTVQADVSGLAGYDNYDITTIDGSLFVNPSVGCNDRIKASDICQEPASIPGEPAITTRLQFTYENRLDIPIYVPIGPNNKLKGNAYYVGSQPELFLPGTHTFEIFTDGGRLQWEIITPGCNSASKSANGSNADPCSTSGKTDVTDFDESIVIDEGISGIYPNPVETSIVFPMHGQRTSFSIKVFNEVGMLMLQKDYPENTYYDVTMDISMLKSGMLYFMVEKNGKREVHRIFKR